MSLENPTRLLICFQYIIYKYKCVIMCEQNIKKNKIKLTIITPTYNRAELLRLLYNSLEAQTNKEFMWLIVDDGSKDNTVLYINSIIKSASFKIDYYRKNNGGKHTALNFGIELINTELTMIVDSDDTLCEDAVDSILRVHKNYCDYDRVGFYTFLKGYDLKKPVVSIEGDEFEANYIDYRIKNSRAGDMAEVFKTSVLKKHKFPEFKDEKFLSEDVVWIQIGKDYNTIYINKIIYLCNYLEGGLSKSDKKLKFASPIGSMVRGKQLMSIECGFKANIKGSIIYNAYNIINKRKEKYVILLGIREKMLCFFTKPLGFVFYYIWRKEAKK